MSTTTSEVTVSTDVQGLARQLLRRLMAERNLRTAGIAQLLNVEAHTVRRMLNGSRAIALDEMVDIARHGGYSLDGHFNLSSTTSIQSNSRQGNVNEGLGRVFGAIAELLSSAPVGAHNFETREQLVAQRRGESSPRDMVAQLSNQAQESLQRLVAGEGEKRQRGRPPEGRVTLVASEAEAYWKDWIEGERSVATLRVHTIPLLEQIRLASQRQDWEAFQRLVETYSFPAQYCEAEPLLTTFEWGLMQINLIIADDLCMQGDLERALEHVNYVRQTLRVGDDRRAEHGMVLRPNSELRITSIGIQAQCLLQDGKLFTNPPELDTTLLAAEFWRAADSLISNLNDRKQEGDDYVRMLMHVLARFELDVCKLCWRYSDAFCKISIDLFNHRTGNQLERELRHFVTLDATDSRSGWYWDFELSKLETAKDYTRDEVLLCSHQRSLGARLSVGSGPLLHMEQLWSRQIIRLLDNREKN